MRRWKKAIALVVSLAVLAGVLSILILAPASAAYACPQCYGLTRIAPAIYVEVRSSEADRARLLDDIDAAKRRVDAFFLKRVSDSPIILACKSDVCDRRLGGMGAKARAFGSNLIHVSPGGWNTTILAHELSHIEYRARVGWTALLSGALPAWFDEGLAVIVSRDARYLSFDSDGTETCRQAASNDLPKGPREWRHQAGRGERPIYAMAACRVLNWMQAHGGRSAVIGLAKRLRDGGKFDE